MKDANDYIGLVATEHQGKPKFEATLRAALAPLVETQQLLYGMIAEFDLDQAVGAQLDQIGLWVGCGRTMSTPIVGVYFSFDTADLGWDRGVWKGPFDPSNGLMTLDDDHYRTLIRATIAANHWDGTVGGSQVAMAEVFPDGTTTMFVQDGQDMSMSYAISGTRPSALFLAMLTQGYIPLKPAGVRLNYSITSTNGAPLFGFDADNDIIGGWDHGAWGVNV